MAQKKICVAFLGNKPSVLCKCSASYEVGGLMYCGRHVKAAEKAFDIKVDAITHAEDLSHDECSICYEQIAFVSEQMTLPCKHAFHKKCVSKWFTQNAKSTCPMCRTIVPTMKKPDLEVSLEFVNISRWYRVQPLFLQCAVDIRKNDLSRENEYTKRKNHRKVVMQLRMSLVEQGVLQS